MESLRGFLRDLVASLPSDACEYNGEGRLIIPSTLDNPSRKRFDPGNFTRPDPDAGSASNNQETAIWRSLAAFINNIDDVANLEDLDGFDIPEPVSA
jgi:hypothetical protein